MGAATSVPHRPSDAGDGAVSPSLAGGAAPTTSTVLIDVLLQLLDSPALSSVASLSSDAAVDYLDIMAHLSKLETEQLAGNKTKRRDQLIPLIQASVRRERDERLASILDVAALDSSRADLGECHVELVHGHSRCSPCHATVIGLWVPDRSEFELTHMSQHTPPTRLQAEHVTSWRTNCHLECYQAHPPLWLTALLRHHRRRSRLCSHDCCRRWPPHSLQRLTPQTS